MTTKKVKVILRWLHIFLGTVIMFYIYSPFHKYPAFQIFVKFVVIPLIAFSGLWLWKFTSFNRFFRIRP